MTRSTAAGIAGDLRKDIRTGRYGPGIQLPSARMLSERYGVAKATATAAVDALKREGLVVGRPGAGWFVADLTGPATVMRARLDDDERARGYVIEQITARAATSDEAARIGVSAGAPVLAVTRLAMTPAGQKGETVTDVLPGSRHLIYELPCRE